MKVRDIQSEAREELTAERKEKAHTLLKHKLKELDIARRVVADLERKLNAFLEKDIEEVDEHPQYATVDLSINPFTDIVGGEVHQSHSRPDYRDLESMTVFELLKAAREKIRNG